MQYNLPMAIWFIFCSRSDSLNKRPPGDKSQGSGDKSQTRGRQKSCHCSDGCGSRCRCGRPPGGGHLVEMATCPGSAWLQKAKRWCSSFGKKHGALKTSNPAPQSNLFYFGFVFVDVVHVHCPFFVLTSRLKSLKCKAFRFSLKAPDLKKKRILLWIWTQKRRTFIILHLVGEVLRRPSVNVSQWKLPLGIYFWEFHSNQQSLAST